MFAVSPMRTIDAAPRTVTSISPSRTWNVSSKSWRYMSQTLAAVLVFIAARLLLEEVVHVPPIVSLAGVLLILGVGPVAGGRPQAAARPPRAGGPPTTSLPAAANGTGVDARLSGSEVLAPE